MKNEKLNLSQLKVKSFVTDMGMSKKNIIKGGGASANPDCTMARYCPQVN